MNNRSRKTTRLKNHDYAQNGIYFITICVEGRHCLFGEIQNGQMVLNAAGEMIKKWWMKLTQKYDGIHVDEFCVMPNHIHGIINILRINDGSGAGRTLGSDNGRTLGSAPTCGTLMQWFKTMSTNEYIRHVKNDGWPAFNKRLWQRNYYEHVIRNMADWINMRAYIVDNPSQWGNDNENLIPLVDGTNYRVGADPSVRPVT